MMHCGLLGGLLFLLIHLAASQNLTDNGGNSPNITVNVESENTKNLTEEVPRWLFGWDHQQVNKPHALPGNHKPDKEHSHDSSAHSHSHHSKSSEEHPPRTSEESEEDRSATTKRPKTTRMMTTAKPSRESKDSHSDSSHKSSESHSERSSESSHSDGSHRSSEESPETTKRPTKRTTVTPKTTTKKSHESSSSSSSEERPATTKRPTKRTTVTPKTTTKKSHESHSSSSSEERPETTKRPTKRTTVTPKTTTKKSHESYSSSSSEERPETTKRPTKRTTVTPKTTTWKSHESYSSSSSEERPATTKRPTKRTTVTPKTTTKKSHESHSSSSSSEESEESSKETCVGHKPSKLNKFWGPDGHKSIEDSRKPIKRCRSHHKKPCACSHYPYRSLNGTCNNLKYPDCGVIKTPLRRVVPARYCDGKSTVRRSATDGRPLPCSRVITSRVFGTTNTKHETITQLAAIFWIFVAEDIFLLKRRERKDSHRCCAPDGNMIPKKHLPRSCLPIKIPKHDPFFSKFHQRCLNYERSETVKCKEDKHQSHEEVHHIDQLNSKTSYLDLHPVYGTCKEETSKLRAHEKGLLKTKLVKCKHHDKLHRSFLPNVVDARKVCGAKRKDDICYLSGNSQANNIIALAALQTLLVRYHNNVALRLHKMHPHWNDEDLFQQTRKIMIAIYQNIVYNEWILTLLGKETLKRLKLPFNKLSLTNYDYNVDAGAISDMASAGLSMSNTLLSSLISLMDEKRHTQEKIHLIRTINHPSTLEKNNNFDSIIRGLTAQPTEAFDGNFTKEFMNLEVINKDGKVSGIDLVATDIQMGRDYGITTYNDAREICHLKRAKKFEDFKDTLNKKSIQKLQHVYSCPNDVDLLVGLLLEEHYDGGVLGRVGNCIFGEQFVRLCKGDRFFANVKAHEHSFTKDQLDAILAVKMSTLVCRSSDHVEHMQLKAFRQISPQNELKDCSGIPKLDLKPWENMELSENKC